VFNVNRFSGTPPEERYLEGIEKNYGIKHQTVEEFRKQLIGYVNQIDRKAIDDHTYKRLRGYIAEEVFNPLFKRKILNGRNDVKGSLAVAMVKENTDKGLDSLEKAYQESKEELHLFSREVQEQFKHRVRNISKTIPFTPQRSWKNKI
jgi:hypothetical protein